jgi:hypothetical protein
LNNFIIISLIVLLFSSCSSFKKSIFTGSLVGASAGAIGGAIISDQHGDKKANAFGFGSLLAGIGSWVGYFLYHKSIENKKLFNDKKKLKAVYDVPTQSLPSHLKNKIKGQKVIEYIVPEERTNDGRIIEEHRVWKIMPSEGP